MLSVDLWEAWVDLGVNENGNGGILYVLGDVYIGGAKVDPVLKKVNNHNGHPAHLYLELSPAVIEDEGRVAEVSYSEVLESETQYSKIKICIGSEVVAEIEEIEQVI